MRLTRMDGCSGFDGSGCMTLLKWLAKAILILVIGACLAVTVIPPFLDRIYYSGPETSHFDGERFFNPGPDDTFKMPARRGGRTGFFLRWISGQDGRAVWPERVIVKPAKPRELPPLAPGEMRAIWVGHATVLIQTPELNILTDPIWSENAGPFGFGPGRVVEPGIRFDDLPKIDLVIVSHNHYDHMDLDTIKRLHARDKPIIVSSLGNDALLNRTGTKAIALDWGQRTVVKPGVEVVVTRNHHWSSRWFADQRRALWSSFVIRLPGGNIFFAGDTGFGDGHWPAEARALGPVRLGIIPIGAFRFADGMMDTGSHIGPIKAERVFARLGASFGIPIHWGTFQLSNEERDTPPRMLAEVMKCAGFAGKAPFAAVEIGAVTDVPPIIASPYSAPSDEGSKGKEPAPACLEAPAITGLK
jgi:L-ascorbate metabolism protein UlaG (beta-lactamase superfamily)